MQSSECTEHSVIYTQSSMYTILYIVYTISDTEANVTSDSAQYTHYILI